MKDSNPNGLDIDLLQTPLPGKITIEVDGHGKIVVDPAYDTLAEGLCDAIIIFAQGKVMRMDVETVIANTKVVEIDTDRRFIKIEYNYPPGVVHGKPLAPLPTL